MKQFLLITCLFAFSVSFAQAVQRTLPFNGDDKVVGDMQLSATAPTMIGHYDKLLVADTIFPATLSLQCAADSIALFSVDPAGFVTGTNSFFDLWKLQRVTLPEETNLSINQALVAFAVADSTVADRQIVVDIYAGLDANGNPAGFAGASDTLLVSDLVIPEQGLVFTSFPFSTPAALTNASSFLISVNFVDIYFNEVDSVDYVGNVGVWHTVNGCGDGTNALETYLLQNGSLETETLFANWDNLNVEMYMGAIVERDPFTSTRTPLVDYGATATPNPATEDLAITFNASGNEQLTASLLTADGRVVRSQSVRASAGRVDWIVADLPAGLYLYQLAGSAGVQTGKVIVR